MKQLVCAKDVETLKGEGKTELCIDQDAIVTPSARDAADSLGVTFRYWSSSCQAPHQSLTISP